MTANEQQQARTPLPRRYYTGLMHLARSRWRALASLLGLTLFMIGLGVVTHAAIIEALRGILAKNLQAVIEADVTALKIWMENAKAEARLWSERNVLSGEIAGLLRTATQTNDTRQALLASRDQPRLRELLKLDPQGQEERGFLIIDRTGLILASDEDRYVGLRLNAEGMGMLGQILEQDAFISHPFREGDLVAGIPVDPNKTRMLAASPIQDEAGSIIAALAFVIDPTQDFTRILSVARIGETGNTYAFNRQGVLLSDSRFEEQLKELGLLPNAPGAQSILNLQIRDPGGDLTRGYKPDRPPAGWPLTKMAAAAASGKNAMDLEGYRDYRGVKVMGAWRWLPEYDLGVATEVSEAEALQAIRPLLFAYRILFWLLVLTVVAFVITYAIIRRLRLRIHEAQQIDRYRLEKKIGEGGMGEVYLARHQLLRRPTAIKLLRPDKASPETLARFEREVQLTSGLTHPNTIVIYDYGHTPEGIFYYVMEYLNGITLARLIELEGAVAPARVIHILRQVCASLQEAHGIGLIHRDIKPLNIILCQMGGEPDFVKVLDFGLVREIELPEDQEVTETHVINGTPLYIAPERLRNPRHIDARSDIYSLGVVGYNLLTGKDLYQGAGALEISHHTLHSPVPRASKNSSHPIPAALDELIVQCLAKDPEARPPSAREVMERLEAIADENSWDWREATRWWESHAGQIEGVRRNGREAPEPPAGEGDSKTLNVRRAS